MRRDQLELGARYLGSDKRCYEVIDLTPGWRIGFDLDWVKDDSTRQRTMHGKKVLFRKNNALRAIVHSEDGTQIKAVILPSRLLRVWDDSALIRTRQQIDFAQSLIKEVIRLNHWARPSRKVVDHGILDDGLTIKIAAEDLRTLLALVPEVSPTLDLFPEQRDSRIEPSGL